MARFPAAAKIALVIGALILSIPHSANSESQGGFGSLSGKVVDATTGAPLDAATVTVKGTSLKQSTDGDGFFLLEKVPVGGVLLEVARIGYKSRELSVSVAPDDKNQWTVALARLKAH